MSITLLIEDAKWRKTRGLQARLKRAAKRTLDENAREGSLTILLTKDARLKALNLSFRGKDAPTNVLSFPTGAQSGEVDTGSPQDCATKQSSEDDEAYLGDIAIAYAVTAKEAKAAGKSLADHACHLAVHGVLHLLNFDHVRPRDAKIMEKMETAILAQLGIPDPYAQKS